MPVGELMIAVGEFGPPPPRDVVMVIVGRLEPLPSALKFIVAKQKNRENKHVLVAFEFALVTGYVGQVSRPISEYQHVLS